MGVIEIGPEAGPVEEARGRIYAFLGALSRIRTQESGGGF